MIPQHIYNKSMVTTTRKRKNYTLLYVLLIVFIFFLSKWCIEGAYFRKDLVINTVPVENLYGQIQRSGQSPLWAPELAGGYPLLGIAQLGFWYPPHMLLRQFLPGVWTLNISLLLHAMLAATGTFIFLKHNKIHSIAAGAGALLFPLGATFVGKYESLNLILPFMWVPLLLIILQLFMERGKVTYLTAWIGANALCVLVGHPQMALYVIILQAIFVLCITGMAWRRWPRALISLVGVFIVLGLTSFYLLPIIDNISETDRASGTLKPNAQGMFDYQFTPSAFLNLVLPHPFGHHETYHGPTNENELSSYIGPIGIILAMFGFFFSRRKFRFIWVLSTSLIIVGLVLAVGGYSPIFKWLVTHGWNYFNAPSRFFFYTYIGLVFFVSAGLDIAISRMQVMRYKNTGIAVLVLCTVLPPLVVSWFWNDGVPWNLTHEPVFASILRKEIGSTRVFSGKVISELAPDNDFNIKAWNPVCSRCLYRQSFTSPFDSMDGISVKLSSFPLEDGMIELRVYTKTGEQIRESSIAAKDIISSDWNDFKFKKIENSTDKEFYFEITSNLERQAAPRLLIHLNLTEQYDPSGKLYNCTGGNCTGVQDADAAFKIIAHGSTVQYYDALAPYVSAGFGVGTMQWAGSLPLLSVKDYLGPLGTWGDPLGTGARTMINRFATTHMIGIFPPYRYASNSEGLSLVQSIPFGDSFLRLYRNTEAFPRLQFAEIIKAIPGKIDQVNKLIRLPANQQKTIVADIRQDMNFNTLGNTAQIIQDSRTQVVVQAEQKNDGFLVLRDTLLKGWIATVDSHPTDIIRVDGIFRGVFVPSGTHTVAFQYKPSWTKIAICLEIVSMVLFGILICVSILYKQ